MSFVLPGNARSLRFTGEAKALAPASGSPNRTATALGKPRVRRPTAPPHRIPTPAGATNVTAPSPGVTPRRPPPVTPVAPARTVRADLLPLTYQRPAPSPVVRHKYDSISDDPTMAMDRDDVLPGAARAAKPPVAPNAPAIPHFRAPSQQVVETARLAPVLPDAEPPRGLPYAAWILISVLVGVLSYHVAPAIFLARVQPPPMAQSPSPEPSSMDDR